MDYISEYDESGLELVHISDVLDYIGSGLHRCKLQNKSKYIITLIMFLFSGISDDEDRKRVRNKILNPTHTTHETYESVKSYDIHEAISLVLLGAGIETIVLVCLALFFAVLYYNKM